MNTVEAVSYLLENNLNFRVEVSLDQAKAILRKCRKSNNIPLDLDKMVDDIKNYIGPVNFGVDNPNNGNWNNISISIGNENSLVIYVTVKCFWMANVSQGKIESLLAYIGKDFFADETSVEIKLPEPFMNQKMIDVCARYWWD